MKQYNALLERNTKAEYLLDNFDSLKATGKLDKSEDFYIKSYQKLIDMIGIKGLEVEKKLGRKMTVKERLQGFDI